MALLEKFRTGRKATTEVDDDSAGFAAAAPAGPGFATLGDDRTLGLGLELIRLARVGHPAQTAGHRRAQRLLPFQ